MSPQKGKYLKLAAILFFLLTVSWSLIIMRPAISKFAKANGNNEMMDVFPKTNAEKVYEYFSNTTPEGRSALKTIYTFQDFIYPMLYGPFIFFTLIYFLRKGYPGKNKVWIGIVLPFLMVVFDYMENFNIVAVINAYPKRIPVANYIGFFTIIKWLTGLISATIVIISILKIRADKKNKRSEKT